MNHYLAIDIGGTEIKHGILTEKGDILEFGKFSSRNADGPFVLNAIQEIAISKYNQVKGLAISVPGFIDAKSGYIENGGSFRAFDHFGMKSYLESELSIPVTIENDVNCVAYAEKWLGHAKKDEDFLCATIGTAIGGALFLNGRLYRGISHRAGEFGYMINHDKTENLFHNTLNQTATMLTLRRQFASLKKIPLDTVTGETVFHAFDYEDPDAINIVTDFYDSLARMIYNLYYVINPGKLLLGGGISNRTTFINELESELCKYGLTNDMLEIDTCYFKNHSGLVGATFHHLQNKTV